MNPAIYFRMPRVASDTIMSRVRYRCSILPHALHPKQVQHFLLQNETAFRFTFVRHPYTRFVSAYRWAQQDRDEDLFPFDGYEHHAIGGRSMERVAASLEDLCAHGPAHHFYPQSAYIIDGPRLLVDFIGKFESMLTDYAHVAKRLSLLGDFPWGPNRKAMSGPTMEVDLSDSIRGHLDEFYAEDFEKLRYECS